MNDEERVKELVKQTAELINKVPKDGYDYGKDVALKIFSHKDEEGKPDLALIEYYYYKDPDEDTGVRRVSVIPLAEAIKEIEDRHEES